MATTPTRDTRPRRMRTRIADVATALAVALATVVFLVAAYASLSPVEDSPLFNCHLHGNHICGPSVPWHGFPPLADQ